MHSVRGKTLDGLRRVLDSCWPRLLADVGDLIWLYRPKTWVRVEKKDVNFKGSFANYLVFSF